MWLIRYVGCVPAVDIGSVVLTDHGPFVSRWGIPDRVGDVARVAMSLRALSSRLQAERPATRAALEAFAAKEANELRLVGRAD